MTSEEFNEIRAKALARSIGIYDLACKLAGSDTEDNEDTRDFICIHAQHALNIVQAELLQRGVLHDD